MRHKTVTIPSGAGVDWKALGYLISIASVLFLGADAWQKEHAPWWYYPALIVGMATSIIGMACRYKAHLDEQREIKKAEAEAEAKPARTARRYPAPNPPRRSTAPRSC